MKKSCHYGAYLYLNAFIAFIKLNQFQTPLNIVVVPQLQSVKEVQRRCGMNNTINSDH